MTEPGAGERARELAAALDLLEYGPESTHRGFYDIEGATKLIEGALAAVRLEEARWWQQGQHKSNYDEQNLRLQALERAVEGK